MKQSRHRASIGRRKVSAHAQRHLYNMPKKALDVLIAWKKRSGKEILDHDGTHYMALRAILPNDKVVVTRIEDVEEASAKIFGTMGGSLHLEWRAHWLPIVQSLTGPMTIKHPLA